MNGGGARELAAVVAAVEVGLHRCVAVDATLLADVRLELVAEMLDRELDGDRGRVGERADRARAHPVAQRQQCGDVVGLALAVLDASADLIEPRAALPALGALAAGLV